MERELREKIRAFMSERNLTANKIAKMAKVEPSSLYRFINEDRSVSLATAEKLMKVVDLDCCNH